MTTMTARVDHLIAIADRERIEHRHAKRQIEAAASAIRVQALRDARAAIQAALDEETGK